jgi:hypothetical protein
MKNAINLEDLNKMSKGKKSLLDKKPKKRTYYDRLNDAVDHGFSFKRDLFSYDEEKKELYIEFRDIILISHNDLLRIKFQSAYKYIKLWKERVVFLLSGKCKKFESSVKIEVLIKTSKSQTLDYDASIACVKFIIDGLVKSNVIEDDTIDYVPLVLTHQEKTKDKMSSIFIVISEISKKELDSYFSNSFKSLRKS